MEELPAPDGTAFGTPHAEECPNDLSGPTSSMIPGHQDFPAQFGLSGPRTTPGPTVLIPLCRKGDRAGIEKHLRAGSGSVEETDIEGNTPLHVAVEAPRNEIATVQCLLEYDAPVNVVNCLGAAPLHYVCLRNSNHRGVANILLEHAAMIDCQTLAGKTPLHFACEKQLPELVETLTLFGADCNLPDVEGNLAIHLTLSRAGGRDTVKRQIVEHLLSQGASFQTPNYEGQMPIHLACRSGYIACLQLLIENQADISALTNAGETGLHLACAGQYAEVTQLLVTSLPSIVHAVDSRSNTALHVCAMHGALDCAALLLRTGIETNVANAQGQTAFDLAKVKGTDLHNTHNADLEQLLKDAQRSDGCRQM